MTEFPRWQEGLAPGQSRDREGELLLGGIPAKQLADRYGTPLLVVNLDVVDAAIGAFAQLGGPEALEVSYAAKAFVTVEFARHLATRSIGLDVCSIGELTTAERGGFPAERITLHGAGKSDEELRAACAGRVGAIVVDGIEELERLARFSGSRCGAAVLLRLNVGIEAQTHAFVRTGGDDTKFGIHPRDEAAAIALLRSRPHLRYEGLHAHVGSQVRERAAYRANAAALMEAASRFAAAGLTSRRIVIGGGFAIATHPDAPGESLDVAATVHDALALVSAAARENRIAPPRLGIEPGRAIVALAGTTLYRVLAVKRQSHRTFVIVDGGIAENPRPALYGARHLVIAADSAGGDAADFTLCGRSCENDELGIARLPSSLRSGALLAMCATGAYTFSMAGNYNRFPRPAVLAVGGGSDRLLARRESLDDVLRGDAVAGEASDESARAPVTL
ncbi:MAG TPA: diaminopimelate decarboxylase [Candidatus Nitrosotalea sp.]|nr:diaminopimelate decarboxylase [Candidatus Nitrosotalea sp.]